MDLQGQGVETLERVLTRERGTWGDGMGAKKGQRGGEGAEERQASRLQGPFPTRMHSPSRQLSARRAAHLLCAWTTQAWRPRAHLPQAHGGPASSRAGRLCPCRRALVSPRGHGVTSFSARAAEDPKRLSAPPHTRNPYPGGLRASGRCGQARPASARAASLPKTSRRKAAFLMAGACVRVVKAMVFPVVMYGCESWTVKKTEC